MQQMQQMHFAFSSYSSFTSLSWSVRYTYPGVLNGRDIKQREATRKYKKQKKKQQNATRQKQQKQQTQQRASASYFSCSLRWCWSNPLPENARSHVSLLFQDASSQERLSRLLPWLPECRRVPLLFHEPRNMQQKKLCEYSQNISVSSLRHANSKIWKWSKVVRVSGDLIIIYNILYIYIIYTYDYTCRPSIKCLQVA